MVLEKKKFLEKIFLGRIEWNDHRFGITVDDLEEHFVIVSFVQ